MSAEYVDILRTELERQRQFLSAEEEQVLLEPAGYESEDDLALDLVKRRQHTFVPVLRDRFVRDGRPLEQWWDLLAEQEGLSGERTMVGAMVVQVLDWVGPHQRSESHDGGIRKQAAAGRGRCWSAFLRPLPWRLGRGRSVSCCWSSRRLSG